LSPLRIILVGVAVNAMFTGLMSAFNSSTGSNHKVLVPYSIVFGAFVLLLADTLGRTIIAKGKPEEVINSELIKSVYGVELEVSEVDGKPYVLTV
jgi:ABC-type Fe3+-siderophore transport system permease subunit